MSDNLNTREKIEKFNMNFANFLKEKNKRYGDSALNAVKIFSKIETENQICIRLDDKINRVINGKELKKNDICDILGYLELLCIQKDWIDFTDLLD